MESKNKFWKGVLIGALVTAFAGLLIVGMSAGIFLVGRSVIHNQVQTQAQNGGSQNGGSENQANIDWNQVQYKSKRIQSIIRQYFLFDEDGKQVEEYIYKGLMAGLDDPYSVYYTEEEFNDLMEDTTGEYCGIGAMVTKNMVTGMVSIAKVFKGSPAEEAGLKNGDVFYQVGDVEVTADLDLDILVKQHVKGEEGTTVHLKMFRPSIDDYIEADVVRRQIEVPTVEYEMKAENLGYIMVTQFDDVTTEQFKAAISDLESQGMEGLLIDLRGNPGGVLDTAVDMLDYMLPDDLGQYSKEEGKNQGKTLIVSTADRNEQGEKYYCEDGHSVDIPVVILMDGNSASASEVFAGAMRDYDRADLVGTTSFGKGIVQSLLPLGDGSAVKLTTAHYYSPSGFDLHGVGLEPDVEVEYEYPQEANQVGSDGAADVSEGTEDESAEGAATGSGDEAGAGDEGAEAGSGDGAGAGDEGAEAGLGDEAADEEVPDNQLQKGLEVLKEKVLKIGAGSGTGMDSGAFAA